VAALTSTPAMCAADTDHPALLVRTAKVLRAAMLNTIPAMCAAATVLPVPKNRSVLMVRSTVLAIATVATTLTTAMYAVGIAHRAV